MKLIAAVPLLLMVTLALALPFHHLDARNGDGATTASVGHLKRRTEVHHSNNGPPGPNGPSCEHPPCPGLTRDLNIDDALSRREPVQGSSQLRDHPGSKPRAQPPPIHGAPVLDARDDEGRISGPTDPTGPSCEHPPCPKSARDVNIYEPVHSDAMMARHGDHDHDPPSNGPSCKRPPCHGLPSIRALDVAASSQDLLLRELKRNDQDLPPQHHGGVPKDPKVVRAHGAPPPEPYHGSKSPSPSGPPAALRGLRGINEVQERKFSGPPSHPVKGGGAGGHGDVAARVEHGAHPRSSGGAPPVSGSSGSGGFGGGSSGGGGGVLGRDSDGHGPLTGRDVLEDDGSELGPLKGGAGSHGAV